MKKITKKLVQKGESTYTKNEIESNSKAQTEANRIESIPIQYRYNDIANELNHIVWSLR